MNRLCSILLLALLPLTAVSAQVDYAGIVASLIEPAKLATLKDRGANPRVQKYVYWLAMSRAGHLNPTNVATDAVRLAGYTNAMAAELTKAAMLLNLKIAERLGCLNVDGLLEMRKGNSPTVKRGPYAGEELSVDHIIPRAVVPELDNVIANLELIPLKVNEGKGAKIGLRQKHLAEDLFNARLLSAEGLKAVQTHK
jgi:hypothetical protein